MRGKPDNNPWGPAVTMFRTANGTPLYFNFHVTPLEERSIGKRPLGHMLLTGTSGEGKTTLLDFLLCQCMKFNHVCSAMTVTGEWSRLSAVSAATIKFYSRA